MAKSKKNGRIQTRWSILNRVHRKVAVYKELHGLESLEASANILLEKATENIKLPD